MTDLSKLYTTISSVTKPLVTVEHKDVVMLERLDACVKIKINLISRKLNIPTHKYDAYIQTPKRRKLVISVDR